MMIEYVNGETPLAESVTLGYSQRLKAKSGELMHQFADTHHFKSLPSRCLESPNCYNVKLASVRAIYIYLMRVRYLLTLIFSGLDFGKPQDDLPTLVHIAPSNETDVFDAVASSLLQGSML